jgi:hypothetical protein
VHHGLLVARLVVWHQLRLLDGVLLQRLPDAGNVAVAEDAEDSGNQALAMFAVHRPLLCQKLDERLTHRHQS